MSTFLVCCIKFEKITRSSVREAAFFFNGRAIKALTPTPFGLNSRPNFGRRKKSSFFFNGTAFPLPLPKWPCGFPK